ncbi:hypothetical protein AB0D99_31720 [Streptomyces sp. NPDC047971]|uniref:nSTAND1 domain-containing NTPase n=1 Tax=Streptomyces sp. NPDC047971 TaxID=3154499 RepID=UPI0033D12BCE
MLRTADHSLGRSPGHPPVHQPQGDRIHWRCTGDQTVLDILARARLIALDGDTVDLAHEALVTAWPRLDAESRGVGSPGGRADRPSSRCLSVHVAEAKRQFLDQLELLLDEEDER